MYFEVSLNPTHGTTLFRKVLFLLLFWSRLVRSVYRVVALVTILQASPALCPCEHLRPLGDMPAVSCGARSRQYSRLLPAYTERPRSIIEIAGSRPMGRVLNIYEVYFNSRSSDTLRLPSGAPHPLCAGYREGSLCGWDVGPQRGREGPSRRRESHVFLGYITV